LLSTTGFGDRRARIDEREVGRQADRRAIAAPTPLLRGEAKTTGDWVKNDVRVRPEEVSAILDAPATEPPADEHSDAAVPEIEVA